MRLARRIFMASIVLSVQACTAREKSVPMTPLLLGSPVQDATPASSDPAIPTPPPPTWPRTYRSKTGDTVVMYQPQVDAWKDHSKIRFRAAVAVTPVGTRVEYGVVAVEADTLVDDTARTVLMTNMDVAVRFPGTPAVQADPLKKLVKDLLPNLNFLDVSLEQVLAHIHKAPALPKVAVNLDPPTIHYSDVPAILVIFMGQPQFKPVKGERLLFAVNTNWVVLMDTATTMYYLLDGGSWLTAPDVLNGPWAAAAELPAVISELPADGNWADVKKHIPGTPPKTVPRIITSTTPAELIVTTGAPDYSPISGTRLMYVSNPTMPLFWDLVDEDYYYLASGRWFRAEQLTGPWTAASANLPLEFAKIPPTSPMGYVLASIPNTQEAQDAILLASIPHKATIDIQKAKVTVTYEGQPKFNVIEETTMSYAVNTPYEVVLAEGQYYCCYNGVWFVSPAAIGPWAVCTAVPAVIYTIPVSSPIYNVTYCRVYSYTPTTVVVGYTAGYSGEYVAATGALMFGAGMFVGAAMASSSWYACAPCYYSYGCAAHYSYAYGGYYREGTSYYGPHGGCGWGASYNPGTGTYARGAYSYGPEDGHWGAQAYNPFTNTYAAHTGGASGYQSWGQSYVQRGNQWAEAGHQSGARGSVGYAENSSGQWAESARGAGGNSVTRTSSGDYYASHDGDVYKKSDGQWQKYNGNGNWEDTSYKSQAQSSGQIARSSYQSRSSSSSDSWRSDWSSSQWKSDWENRQGGGSGSWGQHDTSFGLNSDSWSRDRSQDSWGSREGGDRGGFGGGRFGGGGGFGGGRFRR